MTRRVLLAVIVFAGGGCAPRAVALKGAPAPERSLPALRIAPGHRKIVFHWNYQENSLNANGDGAIRVAAPDSARVDLFLNGGLFLGKATLIGDNLDAPNRDQVEKVLPPAPMLWAALGRLAIPALPDTVITVDGEVLYADVGRPAAWRVTIKGNRLMQLARLNGGRIAEVVTRDEGGRLLYEVPGRRKLWLGITRDDEVPAFDASIWGP